ncbi:hypothetical protein [Sphingomonas sp. KR3-1]
MPLPLPPRNLLNLDDDQGLPPGMGLMIAFGIGLVSWAIVVALALVLLSR